MVRVAELGPSTGQITLKSNAWYVNHLPSFVKKEKRFEKPTILLITKALGDLLRTETKQMRLTQEWWRNNS